MEIFCQIGHFSMVLIVWGAGVGVLTVCEARCKTGSNLGS